MRHTPHRPAQPASARHPSLPTASHRPCAPDLQLVVAHVGGGGRCGKGQVGEPGISGQLLLESLVGGGGAAQQG